MVPSLKLRILTITVLTAFLAACSTTAPAPEVSRGQPRPYRVRGTWYKPMARAGGFRQRGTASWYGRKFHGRNTSSGEKYNMHAMTAAHKTLPLGTWVQVTNLANGRKVRVRINDRGPFVRGRIIDLSYAAAKKLGMVGPGTAPVEIVALGTSRPGKAGSEAAYQPMDYFSGNFTFQVGAFTDPENARRLVARLRPLYQNAHIAVFNDGQHTFYRVRVGLCRDLASAQQYEQHLMKNGFPEAFLVAE